MHLALVDLGCFSLSEFSLGKIEGGHGAGRRDQTTVQLESPPELLIGRAHESDGQVRHVHRIVLVVGPTARRNR